MKTISYPAPNRGFTLIEMLVTITIIVILAGLTVGGFKFVTTKQANEQAKIQISLISNALEEYKLDKGEYPPGTNSTTPLYKALYFDGVQDDGSKIYLPELDPVNNKQGWTEGTGADVKIIDPWGVEYIYRNPPTVNPDFDLLSKGQDGVTSDILTDQQNKDDITNY